ncbi:hypothetical protein K3495_g2643 [Podosphaera aphanis]|nr:hypothetical protein K3495_g2643 [Podosphaera aphanis]
MTNLNQQDNSDISQRTTDNRAACIEDQNKISILPQKNDLDVQKPLEIQSQKEKQKKNEKRDKLKSKLQVLWLPHKSIKYLIAQMIFCQENPQVVQIRAIKPLKNKEQNDDHGKENRSFHVTASCQVSRPDYKTEDIGAGTSRSENRIEKPLPSYFTRSTKRKRLSTDDETERQFKIIKAMLASGIIYSSDDDEIENAYNAVRFNFAFPLEHKKKKIQATNYESLRPASKKDTRINVTEYQQAIGSLMYAMALTRPDIAFALGKLSHYMSDPAQHHGSALKNLMRYLKATVSQKLRYGPGRGTQFSVYSDADWASDKADRKSVSGGVVMFYGGPISWPSRKQRSVATSSCNSEYIALSISAKQGQWVAQVFRDLNRSGYIGKNPDRVQMYGDN